MRFFKYHALGNDYLIIDPKDGVKGFTQGEVQLICHRNYGIGSDGILFGPLPSASAPFGLKIFNPDGSEAEKSGNGLRIFSRYLWDSQRVTAEEFAIETLGGVVRSTVMQQGAMVRVEMGGVSFSSERIPVAGDSREVVNESVEIGGNSYSFCAATIGNPHCVLPLEQVTESLARELGPQLETHSLFPNRTNVQLLQVLDRKNIRIEIWERGAGYTLASGSSSSAAAAVAKRLGFCDRAISVHMPGGVLEIEVDDEYSVMMTGPVSAVAEGEINPEILEAAKTFGR